jgi:atypical dual specificity phosphatase
MINSVGVANALEFQNESPTRFRKVNWLMARACFYPTLTYGIMMNKMFSRYHWWDRIDDHVLLGALPLKKMVPELVAEGVKGVINCCEEYAGPLSLYDEAGIQQLHLPTIDFTHPQLDDVRRGVEFIGDFSSRNESVYIHCKAGRARSATIALCWMVRKHGMSAEEAQRHLQRFRPYVNKRIYKRGVVSRFCNRAS